MKAIPTTYRSSRFRSRLEARWAAFFDLVGWQWVYEPADYEGWTPDFMLIGKARNVLVEVKPINWTESDGHDGAYWGEHRVEVSKALRNWQHGMTVLLLGTSPIMSNPPALGAMFTGPSDDRFEEYPLESNLAETAELVCQLGRLLDFQPEHKRLPSVLFGLVKVPRADLWDVARLWNEAGSQVQWQPRTKTIGYTTYAESIVARDVELPVPGAL